MYSVECTSLSEAYHELVICESRTLRKSYEGRDMGPLLRPVLLSNMHPAESCSESAHER